MLRIPLRCTLGSHSPAAEGLRSLAREVARLSSPPYHTGGSDAREGVGDWGGEGVGDREKDIVVGEEEVLLMLVLLRELALFRTQGEAEHAQYLLSLPPPSATRTPLTWLPSSVQLLHGTGVVETSLPLLVGLFCLHTRSLLTLATRHRGGRDDRPHAPTAQRNSQTHPANHFIITDRIPGRGAGRGGWGRGWGLGEGERGRRCVSPAEPLVF